MAHEVFEGKDGQYYFHVKGNNGEIVAVSEGYTRKADAERGYGSLENIVLEDYAARKGSAPEAINFRNAVIDTFLDLMADAPVFEMISDEDATPEYKMVVSDLNLNNLLESLGIVGTFGESAQDTIHRIMQERTPEGVVLPDEPETPSETSLPPS
jgi:uncharacterized protein YegP (UPF0339 family)